MNFIFISPAFPSSYYNFCRALKNNGVRVLGIGDTPYASLSQECKDSLDEYYYVYNLECYDEVFRAVAYFSYKYGKIDYLESNNEYWLKQDSRLRDDFNINGSRYNEVLGFTSKIKMKDFYKKANVKCARYKICTSIAEDLKFIQEVGYPVVVKPTVGVGAAATYKISSQADLEKFYNDGFNEEYIMEEFIYGDIISFDGICDSKSNVLFMDNEIFPPSIMDIVNKNLEFSYYVNKEVPKDLEEIGKRVIKAFGIKKRFFHLEFFRLKEAKEGLGTKGDIVALEVNMRPPGGYTPDMINYSQSVSTYQIYADVICYDEIRNVDLSMTKYYTLYCGRRNRFNYANSYSDIKAMNPDILMHGIIPKALEGAMGNEFYVAKFESFSDLLEFEEYVMRHKE